MDELYRMLGQERRADFEREARRRSLAALATRPQPSSSVLPVLRWTLRKTDRTRRSDGKEQIVTHTRIYVKRQKLARRIERAAVPGSARSSVVDLAISSNPVSPPPALRRFMPSEQRCGTRASRSTTRRSKR